MEKYANTIPVLVTHVSYTELHEHNSRIFQYSSILELRQLSPCYSLYKTPVEIRQPNQFAYFAAFVHFRITLNDFGLFSAQNSFGNMPTFSIFPYIYTPEHPASELRQQGQRKQCKIGQTI